MEKIKNLRKILNKELIDGYLIPKNDEFFGEYIPDHKDRLKIYLQFFWLLWISSNFKKSKLSFC